MRKKILLFLGLILLIIFTIIIFNKTFFKNYYEVTNLEGKKIKIPIPRFSYYETKTKTFITTRSVEGVRNILNTYVENLQSCYDESYFYDSKLDITISRYYVENGFPFNKIYLLYEYGNYCENEFVLDDEWYNGMIEKAKFEEITINKCFFEDDDNKCIEKQISAEQIINIFNYILEKGERVENKKNISMNELENRHWITGYYYMNKKNYLLSIFIYDNNYLVFKVTDENDHSKNAVYIIKEDINSLFETIYNRY